MWNKYVGFGFSPSVQFAHFSTIAPYICSHFAETFVHLPLCIDDYFSSSFSLVQVDEFMRPYCDMDESLPSIPTHPHDRLKTASIRGFILNKDLIALALYILRNAGLLELMTVRTKNESDRWIADHFLRGEDPRNVVNIIKESLVWHW